MRMRKRLLAAVLLLSMILTILPTAVMAVDTLKSVKYLHEPYQYNPATQQYEIVTDDSSVPQGEREGLSLRNAISNLNFPHKYNSTVSNVLNPYTFDVPFVDATGVGKDASGRTVMEYTYQGVPHKWICIGYIAGNGIQLWTEDELEAGNATVEFRYDKGTITYVWVSEDKLAENMGDDYEQVDITFHLSDHILANGGQTVYQPFDVPDSCDFSQAVAVLYVSETNIGNDPIEIRDAIDAGTLVPIEESTDLNGYYNKENHTVTIHWPKGYRISFSNAWQSLFPNTKYMYVKVTAGDYEWYRDISTSSWSNQAEVSSSSTGIKQTTAREDMDLYARMSWGDTPIAAAGKAIISKITSYSRLEDGSDWSKNGFNAVRSQISYQSDYGQNFIVPAQNWAFTVPTPSATTVSENGEVLLEDANNTWRCVGYTIDVDDYRDTGSYTEKTDWRNPDVITIEDTSDLNEITNSYSGYEHARYIHIYYFWEVDWDGEQPPEMYDIEYNVNQAGLEALGIKIADISRIDGIRFDDSTEQYYISANHDYSITFAELTDRLSKITNETNSPVREQRQFTVGKYPEYGSNVSGEQYYDFLLQAEDENRFFKFGGWLGEDGKIYDFGDIAKATSDLIGDDDTITFRVNWVEIDALEDSDLSQIEDELALDTFWSGSNVRESILITQNTDTNPNLDLYDYRTGNPVNLDENGIISYQVSAGLDSTLPGIYGSIGQNYCKDFASIQFHVNIDENLTFANLDDNGQAQITFSAAPRGSKSFAPVTLEACNITDAVIHSTAEGVYTITFDPDNVETDGNGQMYIELRLQWADGQWQSGYPVSNTDSTAPMTISGLDFKLKEGSVSSDGQAPYIESSANITAQIFPRYKTFNLREYYETAVNLLRSEEWHEYFIGSAADDRGSIAYAHALTEAYASAMQFMNYKLKDYDLADDVTSSFKANTVIANRDSIVVTPADITIYMGGNDGYDAVVDGTTASTPSNSMPTPLFYVDLPADLAGMDIEKDISLAGNERRQWSFRLAGTDSDGKNLYYIDSTGFEGQDPVRVSFKGEDGKYHLNDTFDPTVVDELFTTYEISIYGGNAGTVLAQVNGVAHSVVASKTGKLTVRAVEETTQNPVIAVTEAVTAPVAAGSAAITAPQETIYTLNDTSVPVNSNGIGLLFDSIIDDDTHNRTDALVEAIEDRFDTTIPDGCFQAQYLDLVDADNGNAWIKASNDVTVYWGYPEGTNQSTKFTLYHFTGLHRDGSNSGFDMEDISKSAIEVVDIEKTANGIAFDVEPGGFSPFVLVWEKPSWPIIIPDIPEDTTPELLNTYDHDAYIQGYPDGRVKPENNITRAEVATIFYRLLTDDARNYYYSTDSGFSDVKPGDWYNTAVSTMVNAGILTGYNDGSFRPNDPITRAEFATIAARFLSDPYSLQDRFYDTEGHWAEVYINRAAEVGWINGYNDGSFRPNQAITRAEAVTLVNNVLGREPHADYMLDDMITWPDNPKSAWYYEDIQEATNSHDYRWSSGKRYEIWTSLN